MEIKYIDFIQEILNKRENVKIEDEYMEQHHILPKSKGGSNDEDNLIWLLPEEHYIAHKLLSLENPEDYQLASAWYLMSHVKSGNQERIIVDEKEYGEAKRAFSKVCSERYKGAGNPNYGGGNMSEEGKKRLGEAVRKRQIGKKYDDDIKAVWSDIRKKWWENHIISEEEHKNRSEAAKKRNSISIKNVELNKIFNSYKEAAEYLGYKKTSNIKQAILNNSLCYRYHWELVQ